MSSTSSTLTSVALLIWKALQARGLDSRAIFKKAGLDFKKLGDGNERYRLTQMKRLWEISLEETNDPCFGIEIGKSWAPTTFHALGYVWLASHSLKDALSQFTRYSHIVNNSLITSLEVKGAHLHFIYTTDDDMSVHRAGRDAGVAAIITMCRMLCGPGFSPVQINVVQKRNRCSDQLDLFAGIVINYESETNLIVFDNMLSEQRLATGNSELVKVNENVAIKYLNSLVRDSVVMQIKAALVEMMPRGHVSEQEIACKLNMSVRTLQRKLSEENTCFTVLYKSSRQEMAKVYIEDPQISITEISYLLGYSEQGNFTRAFKRWYGTSPSATRQNIQNADFI